jgi:quercetin dioxygenase-like cupin family protein
MKYQLKLTLLAVTICFAIVSCEQPQTKENMKNETSAIFPMEEPVNGETFTGKVWHTELVPNDSTLTTVVGNVYFEPGARSHWHSHPAGQILLITDGVGFHQIKGQPKQTLKKGDVVTCPPNVLHWHGASPDMGMQQLFIVPNTEKGIVEWKDAVTDAEYSN